jgi:penicillin amidase
MSLSPTAASKPTAASRPRLRIARKRWLRRLLLALEVLALVVVLAVFTMAIALRHAMHTALPQIDGELHLAGLAAPVTITRDTQGVPSLNAASLDDLLFAQGFVTAQDRFFQMDALRRHAAGELAEILGPSLVGHDRLQRTLQLRAAADRAVAVLPADQLRQLEAYARGVNAFLTTQADTLPVEFHLLHYVPAPWLPRDSLLVGLAMSEDLSTSFPEKLHREALSAHLPPELLSDLYPVGSWHDRPPRPAELDLTTPTPRIHSAPLDESQARKEAPAVSPQSLLKVSPELRPFACADCRAGSNNWVIAGSRSASGFPLLSNDMHLGLSVPDIWYEAALHLNDHSLDVEGFTLPGVPFVIAGRNAHVAWGFTNTGADVQDVLVEHLRGTGDNAEFERPDGSWSPVAHHSELIRVRGGHNVVLDVLSTTHTVGAATISTPVLSALYPGEQRALSLAWSVYDPANVSSPFLQIDSAPDAASLVAAFAGFGGPSQNLVYADAHHIGYHALGRIPIRGPAVHYPRPVPQVIVPDAETSDEEDSVDSSDDDLPPPPPPIDYTIGSPISTVPIDALDPLQAWSGYIPYSDLPQVLDPASGVLATANARITPDDYPYFFTNNWVDPYRVERIRHLLDGRTGLTPADMLRIQTDVHSSFDRFVAQRLAYALDHASADATRRDTRRLHQAADLLREWDGEVSSDSSAAAIAAAARTEIWPMLISAQVRAHDGPNSKPPAEDLAKLYAWGERNSALEQVLQHQPARWLPARFGSWNDLLAVAVEQGLQQANAPGNLSRWHYGSYHPIEIAHPILGSDSLLSVLLGVRTGSGEQSASGGGNTVKQMGPHFGPSERFTADLANPDATHANITTGESGSPASPWYFDQFVPWLHGTTFDLPLEHPAVAHTLRLVPQ